MSIKPSKEHKWSGWPGAYCLLCGAEDPYERALVDGIIDFEKLPDGTYDIVIPPAAQEEINKALICPVADEGEGEEDEAE